MDEKQNEPKQVKRRTKEKNNKEQREKVKHTTQNKNRIFSIDRQTKLPNRLFARSGHMVQN